MKALIYGFFKKYRLKITISIIIFVIGIAIFVAIFGSEKDEPKKEQASEQIEMVNDSTMKIDGIILTPAETKEERKRILQERIERLETEKSENRIYFWKNLFWSILKSLIIAATIYQFILKVAPRMYTAYLTKKAGGTGAAAGTTPAGTPAPAAKTPAAAIVAPVKETSSAKKIINAFVAMLIILGFVVFFTGTERVNSFLKGHGIGGIFPVSWDIGFHDTTPKAPEPKVVYVNSEPNALISIGSNNKKTIVVEKEDEASTNTGNSNQEVAQAVVTGPFTPVPVPQMMN